MRMLSYLSVGLVALLTGLPGIAPAQGVYRLGSGIELGEIRVLFADTLNDRLLAGGSFQRVDGMKINTTASWDGTRWDSLDNRLSPGGGGFCIDLCYFQSTIFASGVLGLYESGSWIDAPPLVRYVNNKWEAVGSSYRSEVIVYDMIVQDSDLWLLGLFDTLNDVPANMVARYDGQDFYGLPPLDTLEARIVTGAFYEGSLYVGGNFDSQLRSDMKDIARWDGSQWQPVGGGMSGPFSWVNDMIVFDSLLILGGYFFQYQGDPGNAVVAWDGYDWVPMGQGFNGQIHDLEIHNGELYAAGAFSHTGNRQVEAVARWDGSQWQKIADFEYAATALASWEGDLYIGGGIALRANGQPMYGICRYGAATGIWPVGADTAVLRAWPVPGAGVVTVGLPDFVAGHGGVLRLCDAMGRAVMPEIRVSAYETEARIDIQSLSAGVYHLTCESSGQVAVARLVRE